MLQMKRHRDGVLLFYFQAIGGLARGLCVNKFNSTLPPSPIEQRAGSLNKVFCLIRGELMASGWCRCTSRTLQISAYKFDYLAFISSLKLACSKEFFWEDFKIGENFRKLNSTKLGFLNNYSKYRLRLQLQMGSNRLMTHLELIDFTSAARKTKTRWSCNSRNSDSITDRGFCKSDTFKFDQLERFYLNTSALGHFYYMRANIRPAGCV